MTWDYIAGFFDGEGSINHNGKGFRITIAQTNKEVLENIQKFTGMGNIFEAHKRKEHWKDCWVYYIANQQDVYKFLTNTAKFLIVKKEYTTITIPKLKSIVEQQYKRKVKREKRVTDAKKLRRRGLTYRQIGKELGIDWGYARRLVLK